MVLTVAVTVATENLAYGVVAGVLLATLLFARRVAHLTSVTRRDASDDDGERVYAVSGELFFASSNDLVYQFDYEGTPSGSSSTCPARTSGTPRPWPRWTRSPPSTRRRARRR
jgi:hypothetical protein